MKHLAYGFNFEGLTVLDLAIEFEINVSQSVSLPSMNLLIVILQWIWLLFVVKIDRAVDELYCEDYRINNLTCDQ